MTSETSVPRLLETFFDHQHLRLTSVERCQHRRQTSHRTVPIFFYQFTGNLKFVVAFKTLLNGAGLLQNLR